MLHKVDTAHRLSGPATRRILHREYHIFGKKEFSRLSQISTSHIYNLRQRSIYLHLGLVFKKTSPVVRNIGIRTKSNPQGQPGYLRVDSVHQGDKDGAKGIYFINFVDEVTQMEFVLTTPTISEKYMKRILTLLLKICPIRIINFHSDNGSEYINKILPAYSTSFISGRPSLEPEGIMTMPWWKPRMVQ